MGGKKKNMRKWNVSKAWKCGEDEVSCESTVSEFSCDASVKNGKIEDYRIIQGITPKDICVRKKIMTVEIVAPI